MLNAQILLKFVKKQFLENILGKRILKLMKLVKLKLISIDVGDLN